MSQHEANKDIYSKAGMTAKNSQFSLMTRKMYEILEEEN